MATLELRTAGIGCACHEAFIFERLPRRVTVGAPSGVNLKEYRR